MGKFELLQDTFTTNSINFHYYEIKNELHALVMLHAQGTDALSYKDTFKELSKYFHIYSVEYPGHGLSSKDKNTYNIVSIGEGIIEFIRNVVKVPSYIIGHSSGGLIAAYIASKSEVCNGLVLEDPPFFSCQGDRRYKTYNYLDLSSVCHKYIESKCNDDFVLYYFKYQKMWGFFPEKNRDKIKARLTKCAEKYRSKHPDKSLKIPFFPKAALAAYQGMNDYDPFFGEAFYEDTFNAGILHEDILKNITCRTLYMKANTGYGDDGTLFAANSEEDAQRVKELISNCKIVRFDCGHGIHIEKKKEFINAIIDFNK